MTSCTRQDQPAKRITGWIRWKNRPPVKTLQTMGLPHLSFLEQDVHCSRILKRSKSIASSRAILKGQTTLIEISYFIDSRTWKSTLLKKCDVKEWSDWRACNSWVLSTQLRERTFNCANEVIAELATRDCCSAGMSLLNHFFQRQLPKHLTTNLPPPDLSFQKFTPEPPSSPKPAQSQLSGNHSWNSLRHCPFLTQASENIVLKIWLSTQASRNHPLQVYFLREITSDWKLVSPRRSFQKIPSLLVSSNHSLWHLAFDNNSSEHSILEITTQNVSLKLNPACRNHLPACIFHIELAEKYSRAWISQIKLPRNDFQAYFFQHQLPKNHLWSFISRTQLQQVVYQSYLDLVQLAFLRIKFFK